MSTNSVEITDQNFETAVLQSKIPMIVDFWAPWCGPCKMISPLLEELAAEYSGRIVIGKMDIAEHPQKATELGIRSIPSLLFYKGGKLVGSMVGAGAKDKIKSKIDDLLV